MAMQSCPNFEVTFPTDTGSSYAGSSAISAIIAALAESNVARQGRCPKRHHLFAISELGYMTASSSRLGYVLWAVAVIVVFAGADYELLQP